MATDGVYEYVRHSFIVDALKTHADDLDAAARIIVAEAYEQGSNDNLTAQIVRVDDLPAGDADTIQRQMIELPCPPILEARQLIDGYKILRAIYSSSRSHVYLAEDSETKQPAIIKTPSIDLRDDPDYLERFAMEEWIARRINSPYVLKPHRQSRKRSYLYVATEYIDGQTLTQWMIDNPSPDIETVRDIVEQVSKGLRAFHRLEMLHQDIRPENIMIDKSGTVKIIDFGSARVAGIEEIATSIDANALLGTAQYAAPEYFLGESGSPCSDLFSLGVMTYQMLTGKLPYGAEVAKAKTKAAQHRLRYRSVLNDEREIPAWIDSVIRKAVHPNPYKRYQELSEFVYDLRHPNKALLNQPAPPLMQRNPVVFWQSVSFILAVCVAVLLFYATT